MMDESCPPRSPINDLPTEILCKIFPRCVEQSSARVVMQPNTKIAPMLLCQVCAAWRAILLSAPSLWSHLRFELPLSWSRNGDLMTSNPELFVRRLEWLRWWRRNLGSIAPYLQVETQQDPTRNFQQMHLANPYAEFLLDFMSAAQYLSVGRLYRYLVQQWKKAGYVVRIHPNAHTIVSTYKTSLDDPSVRTQYVTSVLAQAHSTLRYLVLEDPWLEPSEFLNPPNNWSLLTRLSLRSITLHLATWFSFIRSVSSLQSAAFGLNLWDSDTDNYIRPASCTLPYLTELDMFASHIGSLSDQHLLETSLDNLHFPTLRRLSLECRAIPWYSFTAITDVHAILASAPAITALSLGLCFLGGQRNPSQGPIVGNPGALPVRDDIAPLVAYAPRLEHLSFDIRTPLRRHSASDFVAIVFRSSKWLDLAAPASTVQKVTLVWRWDTTETYEMDMSAELVNRRLLVAQVREFVKDGVMVECEDQKPAEVRRAEWGW